jgi:hypothetical protein
MTYIMHSHTTSTQESVTEHILQATSFEFFLVESYGEARRLGDVMVSVLIIGPKARGFKPNRSHGFLRVIRIRRMPSF